MNLSVFYVFAVIAFTQGARYINKNTLAKGTGRSAAVKRSYLDCADSTKVEPEMVLQLKKGNWMNDEKLKQWVHCVLMKNNLMTKQGVFQLDVALNKIPPAEKPSLEQHIDDCLPPKKDRPREIAFRFAKCFHQKAPNYTLF